MVGGKMSAALEERFTGGALRFRIGLATLKRKDKDKNSKSYGAGLKVKKDG